MESRPLGRTGREVTEVGICLGDGPGREEVLRRALHLGCRLFWSERPVEAPVVLPGTLSSGYERVAYSLLEQTEANVRIRRLAREGTAVIATRILAGGALTGSGSGRGAELGFLARPGRTLAQAAVQFVLANEAVTCALVRVSTLAHLEEILAAPEAEPLGAQELERIFEFYANRND